jgi:ubiquinone/menaquinone biosynthesis C-methylase UbiE/DNA-binding HxlR family transcriptional regulator
MARSASLAFDAAIAALKAAGEGTRLRILALLGQAELTVKDLTAILGQSQPRISRHLKLLVEAGLIDRHPEGAWVFYRLTDQGPVRQFAGDLLALLDGGDAVLARDREHLAAVKRDHAEAARRYFADHAGEWDSIRALHIAEVAVETAMLSAVGERGFESMLDLGTGTGRLLELFAPLYNRAIGIDASAAMLAVARANLDRAGIGNAQVRLGEIQHLPFQRNSFDLVTVHQVLHFLNDPEGAIAEAARVLRPGGRLLIVDFAPHDLEFLRERHAHRRLGFAPAAMRQWIETAGLSLVTANDLATGDAGSGKLTVTLMLARDKRVAMADEPEPSREVA